MENTSLGLTDAQIAMIGEWTTAKAQAAIYANLERTLRDQITATLFDEAVKTGTEYLPLANGYRLQCVKTESYNIKAEVNAVRAILEKLPTTVANMVVKWKPTLSKPTFDSLSDEERALFNDVMEIKPGAPQVKMISPTEK